MANANEKKNYQIIMEHMISEIKEQGSTPRLLLHSCCAPCSSYCLEMLTQHFKISVFYYNPNIYPDEEYYKREKEQQWFIEKFPAANPIEFVQAPYEKEVFYEMAEGMEDVPEGGERCMKCYRLRLGKAAQYAAENGYDYFTTTLSISPHKNAQALNLIGKELAQKYGVSYLYSDFKKKNGFKRSCEISEEYGIYRQDYCGCEFSVRNNISE